MKPFIGIKKIFYGKPFDGETMDVTNLNTWFGTLTEIKNSHDGTWAYSQDDPETTDYINELTGKPYYRDAVSQGNKTINFTIGQYEFADKVALQGGSLLKDNNVVIGWSAPTEPELKYMGIVGMTKTGGLVIFTNAGIVGKTDTQEKNLGLGVAAVAMESEKNGVSDEYWIDGDAVAITYADGHLSVAAKG